MTPYVRQDGGFHQVDGNLQIQRSRSVHPRGEHEVSGQGGSYTVFGGTLRVDGSCELQAGPRADLVFDDAHPRVYDDGVADFGTDNLHNDGVVTLGGPGSPTLRGKVNNRGLVEVIDACARFEGDFYNHGLLQSDHSISSFESLHVGGAIATVPEPVGHAPLSLAVLVLLQRRWRRNA